MLKINVNGKTYSYGFSSYEDLYKYTKDYIKLYGSSSTPIIPPLDPSNPTSSGSMLGATKAITNGIYATIAAICIIEVAFLTTVFVYKSKKDKFYKTITNQNSSINYNVENKPSNKQENNESENLQINPNIKFKF